MEEERNNNMTLKETLNNVQKKYERTGEVRKDVYEYLESQGFKMTEERHKALSTAMKLLANVKTEEIRAEANKVTLTLHARERAMGVRSWRDSQPILCKTAEDHKKNQCYFPCKFK